MQSSFVIPSAIYPCPPIELSVEQADGSAIDPNVFAFDSEEQVLSIYTADESYNQTDYVLEIKAKY